MPDFTQISHDILAIFSNAGTFGVLLIFLLLLVIVGLSAIIWVVLQFSNFRVLNYRERLEEHRQTGDKLVGIIENNTEAITKMSVAIDNCTESVKQTHSLYEELRHFIKGQ